MQLQRVDNYDINLTKVVGRGQFGTVYECKSLKQGEENLNLCAKIMDVQNEIFAEREEKILNLIMTQYKANQNIVKVYYVKYDQPRKQMVVVMERCQTNLEVVWRNKIKEKKVYTSEMIRDFLRQILNGYIPLYNNCIIHRDLKPENIMVNFSDTNVTYKLADFGVGKNMNDEKSDSAMQTQTGTPVYAPPEINQLVRDDTVQQDLLKCQDPSSIDIYSIGMIMWQMMFGDFPFCKNYVDNPTLVHITEFLENIKGGRFPVFDESKIDQMLLLLIKRMIVYYPSSRVTFRELYQQHNISVVEKQGSGSSSGSTNFSDTAKFQKQFPFSNFQRVLNFNQQTFFTPQMNKAQNFNPPRLFTKPEAQRPQPQVNPQFPSPFPNPNFPQPEANPKFQQAFMNQQNFQPPPPPINQDVRWGSQFNNSGAIKLKLEIIDYLKFFLNNKDMLKPEKVVMFENFVRQLSELTNEKTSTFTLQQIIRGFKNEFPYSQQNCQYSPHYIRFLYLIGLVNTGSSIDDQMLELKQFNQILKLGEWAKQNIFGQKQQ